MEQKEQRRQTELQLETFVAAVLAESKDRIGLCDDAALRIERQYHVGRGRGRYRVDLSVWLDERDGDPTLLALGECKTWCPEHGLGQLLVYRQLLRAPRAFLFLVVLTDLVTSALEAAASEVGILVWPVPRDVLAAGSLAVA
jgi:hypothetical protein